MANDSVAGAQQVGATHLHDWNRAAPKVQMRPTTTGSAFGIGPTRSECVLKSPEAHRSHPSSSSSNKVRESRTRTKLDDEVE